METVVVILLILVCFNFVLKQTFHSWKEWLGISAIIFLFVGMMWPYAIEQSKSQIASWLSNQSLMLDTAVILTIDVVIQISFCLLTVKIQTATKIGRFTRWYYHFLEWFPGILVFPVLFCLLVVTIFAFPGIRFQTVAWSLGATLFMATPLLAFGLRWILPEEEIRLEVLFLCNILTALLGVIATVNGRTAVLGTTEVDGWALAGILCMLLIGGIIGYAWRLFQQKRHRIP